MKLKTFFQKFDQFADAPDAVAKMRELVLELASKGALSERRASDQTDSAWRKFTSEFDGRGERPNSFIPFEIPDVWRWVTLDDLGTTKIRNDVDDETHVSFVPMTLISAKYGVPAKSEERLWREVKKGFTHFAEGDVVMAKITPCFENAKSAVMRNLVNGAGAGTTELLVFRGETKIILPEFVLIYLKTRGFISRGEPRMTGSAGQKRVPREYFAGSPFPLPPLAEQKRIVAKVDELMALCDRLEAQQQEREEQASALARASLARFVEAPTSANLNLLFHKSNTISPADLRQAILTMAVKGKLVPQDANDKPAFARKDIEIDSDIPRGWSSGTVFDLAELKSGNSFMAEQELSEGKYLYVKVSDMNLPENQHEITTSSRFIDPEDRELRGLIPANAIIFPKRGGAIATNKKRLVKTPIFVDSNTMAMICPPFIELRYLHIWFLGIDLWALNSGTSVPQINNKDIGPLVIPVPPFAEQSRIVAKVDQLMTLVDQLEAQLAASRVTAKKLLEAVVAELAAV